MCILIHITTFMVFLINHAAIYTWKKDVFTNGQWGGDTRYLVQFLLEKIKDNNQGSMIQISNGSCN